MLTSYNFNSHYRPVASKHGHLPSLRLLEGGNFTPGQYAPILIKEYGQLRLRFFQWGLIPRWMRQPTSRNIKYYAPAQTVLEDTSFLFAVQRQRCLIPADGYYLNGSTNLSTDAYKFSHPEGETFCFAGIYDQWQAADGSLKYTFSMITVPAPAELTQYNLQMPLILGKEDERAWLNPKANTTYLKQLLQSSKVPSMSIHTVKELHDPNTHLSTHKSLAA